VEARHIEVDPEGEREEIRQLFAQKGFEGNDLNNIVRIITSDKQRWIQTMLIEEYGLAPEVRSAKTAAFVTFVAFVICGFIPMIPFIAGTISQFATASVLTGLVFFGIGSAKAKWSTSPWWRSGLETLLIGGFAALLAYMAGNLLKDLGG
jgi:VIT1/CCC1 family predicted Fe2+/Mn2+ transporter